MQWNCMHVPARTYLTRLRVASINTIASPCTLRGMLATRSLQPAADPVCGRGCNLPGQQAWFLEPPKSTKPFLHNHRIIFFCLVVCAASRRLRRSFHPTSAVRGPCRASLNAWLRVRTGTHSLAAQRVGGGKKTESMCNDTASSMPCWPPQCSRKGVQMRASQPYRFT